MFFESINFRVCIRCLTYNHSDYIEYAMKGFCLQETSFPFVCVILDDSSTDGEQEVIERYIHDHFDLVQMDATHKNDTDDYRMIVAHHKTNKNCYFAVLFLKYNHYQLRKSKSPYFRPWFNKAEFIALCEGDDYWIDPLKLERQVNALESDPKLGMSYTAYRWVFLESGNTHEVYTSSKIKHDETFKWRILEYGVKIGTATVVLRRDLYERILTEYLDDYRGYIMGDTQTWFHFSRLSNVYYYPQITAVYRKHNGGATTPSEMIKRLQFTENSAQLHLNLAFKYGAPKAIIKRIKVCAGTSLIKSYISVRQYDKASQINNEFFSNNLAIRLLIKYSCRRQLSHIPGLGLLVNRFAILL